MAGGDIKGKYGSSNVTIACTFGNNPTGTITQNGRISDAIDNSTNCYQEVLIAGKIKSGTSPSGHKQFIVFGLGSANGGTNYTDGFSPGDANSTALTVQARPICTVAAPNDLQLRSSSGVCCVRDGYSVEVGYLCLQRPWRDGIDDEC